MSSNLYWRPVQSAKNDLPDSLKFALRKRFHTLERLPLSYKELGYFQGLLDAGVEGAQEIIDAIEKYEQIELSEVF